MIYLYLHLIDKTFSSIPRAYKCRRSNTSIYYLLWMNSTRFFYLMLPDIREKKDYLFLSVESQFQLYYKYSPNQINVSPGCGYQQIYEQY